MTAAGRTELEAALLKIVRGGRTALPAVLQRSPGVSRRFHLLELLPGIGKKTMLAIVEERKRGPFKDFTDLEQRLHLKTPELLIVGRIELEMEVSTTSTGSSSPRSGAPAVPHRPGRSPGPSSSSGSPPRSGWGSRSSGTRSSPMPRPRSSPSGPPAGSSRWAEASASSPRRSCAGALARSPSSSGTRAWPSSSSGPSATRSGSSWAMRSRSRSRRPTSSSATCRSR